jgi:hypothetical protein
VADITAASDGQVMRRSGTALAFGAVNLASANAVTGVLPVRQRRHWAIVLHGRSTADRQHLHRRADQGHAHGRLQRHDHQRGRAITIASSAGTGTVTHTAGALTSGQLIVGNGTGDIKVGDLSGDVSTSGSGVTTMVPQLPW